MCRLDSKLNPLIEDFSKLVLHKHGTYFIFYVYCACGDNLIQK
jgi:hypothetical protein